jgi:deazaflavin-dependent oxidoreductase (nitroreductase family)
MIDLEAVAGQPFAYLTTRGRRTGRPHSIEIWFGVDGGRVYLLSGGGDRSDWVCNLRKDPAVMLHIGDGAWAATARVVGDGAEDSAARRLLAAKYQAWREGRALSRWASTALPVAIEPSDRSVQP